MGTHRRTTHPLALLDESNADRLNSRLTEIILGLAKVHGLSNTALAEAMMFDRGMLHKMIHRSPGDPSMWQLWHLCALSRIFNVPVSELMQAAEQDSGNAPLKKRANLCRAKIATEMKRLQSRLDLIAKEEHHGQD